MFMVGAMRSETSIPNPPIQTYGREAERLAAEAAMPGHDPRLVRELARAVRRQAAEISDYIIAKSARPVVGRARP